MLIDLIVGRPPVVDVAISIESIAHLSLLVHGPLVEGAAIFADFHEPNTTVLVEEVVYAVLLLAKLALDPEL